MGVMRVVFSKYHQLPDVFLSYFVFAQNYYWLYNPEGSKAMAY